MIGNAIAGFVGVPPAASPTAYESIATVTVGLLGQSSITFSSIPSTYTHLQLRGIGFATTSFDIFLKLNTDAGVKQHVLLGNGSTVTTPVNSGTVDGQYFGTTGFFVTSPTAIVLDLLDYKDTNKTKTVRALMGYDANGSGRINLSSFLYTGTSAITSITFSGGTFAQYTQFALYGIKGA